MSAGDETPEAAHTPPTAPTEQSPEATQTADTPAGLPKPMSAQTPRTGEAAEGAPTFQAGEGVSNVNPPGAAQHAEASTSAPGPKIVRRVVCSYRLGWLPGDWLQTWRRLDRVFARAELKVKATLAPLEDLPPDTDILVVPPELREAAREAALPGTPILVTPASAAAGAFADLVSRLQLGTEFTAERLDPADKDKPKIVSYRGHTLLD
jgi:hypothetical protein